MPRCLRPERSARTYLRATMMIARRRQRAISDTLKPSCLFGTSLWRSLRIAFVVHENSVHNLRTNDEMTRASFCLPLRESRGLMRFDVRPNFRPAAAADVRPGTRSTTVGATTSSPFARSDCTQVAQSGRSASRAFGRSLSVRPLEALLLGRTVPRLLPRHHDHRRALERDRAAAPKWRAGRLNPRQFAADTAACRPLDRVNFAILAFPQPILP